jgi:hypothetical protein
MTLVGVGNLDLEVTSFIILVSLHGRGSGAVSMAASTSARRFVSAAKLVEKTPVMRVVARRENFMVCMYG